MDDFEKKGFADLKKYRGERTTDNGAEGNFESFAASLIGNDRDKPKLLKTISDLQIANSTKETVIRGLEGQISIKEEAIDSLKEQLKIATDKLKELMETPPVVNPETQFKNHVAQFFYRLAKWAEGGE